MELAVLHYTFSDIKLYGDSKNGIKIINTLAKSYEKWEFIIQCQEMWKHLRIAVAGSRSII